MIHQRRTWAAEPVTNLPALANRLVHGRFPLCQGFGVGPYLLLNDSTTAEGPQEYGVVRPDGLQIWTLTVTWMRAQRLEQVLRYIARGGYDRETPMDLIDLAQRVQTFAQHRGCELCG